EVIVNPAGLEPIDRRQSQWRMLASILGDATTHAYIAQRVSGEGPQPALAYQIKPRQTVETAAARIGLAQTVLVLDAQGAYRAAQSYRLDNSTEQYLEIIVPDGASLWPVRVAGQP